MVHKTAFIYFTHKMDDQTRDTVRKAASDLARLADVFVMGYFKDPDSVPAEFLTDPHFIHYSESDIDRLGFPAKCARPFRLQPGNCDVAFLLFAERFKSYEHIWLFENDVVFTGPLDALVGAFGDSASDLIATNYAPAPKNWPYRARERVPAGWPALSKGQMQVFLPAFRVSRALIDRLMVFYRAGGDGHNETIWSYVAESSGLVLEDFGGKSRYVRDGNRNRFYTSSLASNDFYPGTFRYRPIFAVPGKRKLTLYHPVKAWRYSFVQQMRIRGSNLARLALGMTR